MYITFNDAVHIAQCVERDALDGDPIAQRFIEQVEHIKKEHRSRSLWADRYSTILLYEEDGSCYEFRSLPEVCEWFIANGYSKNKLAARTGIYNLLIGKIPHYRGFTIAVAFKDGYEPPKDFPEYNILPY